VRSEFTLVIGNKNYSSWSLRAWLVLKYFEIPFTEILVSLYQQGSKETILKHSPSGKVPALIHKGRTIWESMAICEYLAEIFPQNKLWPEEPEARAIARSISAEMHAGFQSLRHNMSMNLRASFTGKRTGRMSIFSVSLRFGGNPGNDLVRAAILQLPMPCTLHS
jgi:glutathione S-transferase